MTPNWTILRALHARIAAKPEALVRLNQWLGKSNSCGTPACVLGELCSMPEANRIGLTLAPFFDDDDNSEVWPYLNGRRWSLGDRFDVLGITIREAERLFYPRTEQHIPEKQEALERIEALFLAHGEELHLPDSIEYARRDEVVA